MAANGDSGIPDLPDAVNKPPDGIVLPPKDIRTIVETTAGYVVRNGGAFEERIRDKERQNPKFSFLRPDDAFKPFYEWRLAEIQAGRGTALSARRAGEAAAAATPAAPEKPKGPEQPPDFHFSARMPNISAQDLDVVKLAALFVAKNGRSFMTALSQREARNFQFDFLRPQHSLHQFFSRLVDQYTDLLQAQMVDAGRRHQQRMQELEQNIKDKFRLLEKAKTRSEWVKYQEQQKVKQEEEEQKEQLEYAQIDWHDFVVVETVLFTDADDTASLPPPTSLNDLMNASLEQKAMMSLAPQSRRIEEALPTDDIASYYTTPSQNQYIPPPASASPYPPPFAAPPPVSSPHNLAPGFAAPAPFAPGVNEDEARAIAERSAQQSQLAAAQQAARAGGAPMRIRSDYVPRAQAKRQNVATTLCANCGQHIPLAEYDEHIKIELLDPAWKEQRDRGRDRLASAHVPVIDAARNLALAAGMQGQGQGQGVGQGGGPAVPAKREAEGGRVDEEEKRRRLERGPPAAAMNVNEQLMHLRQKFGGNA